MAFSLLIKGLCANYTESSALKNRTIFLLTKDINNYFKLQYNYSTKCFDFIKCVGGVIVTLSSNAQTFMKFQSYNFLVEQSTTGMSMRLLKNNGTVEKYTNVNVTNFTGVSSLYPLTNNVTGNEADAFLGSIKLFSKNWDDDTEASSLLSLNESLINKGLSNTQTVAVFPNNKYELTSNQSVIVTELYNSIIIKSTTYSSNTTFVTNSKTNRIKLDTVVFTNVDFKKKDI